MKPRKKYLTTHKKGRKYLNALINDFNAEVDPDLQRYRTLTYILRTMLEYFKLEADLQIEQHIRDVEKRLEKFEHEIQSSDQTG